MVIRLEVFFQVLNWHGCHVKYCTKRLKRNDKQELRVLSATKCVVVQK